MRTISAICVALMLFHVATAQEKPAEKIEKDPAKKILDQAQGKWERKMKQGGKLLMIKEIKGNKETISIHRGEVLDSQWTVDFEIKHVNGFNIFTLKNMKVVHGHDKGYTNPGPFSYVFKIQNDHWHEVHGLYSGDQRQPEIKIFKRYDPSNL